MKPKIDFWYSIGSTYTYLSVMRLGEIEKETGIEFEWRPFSVRAIMSEIGNRPFFGKPVKLRYMWRDMERRAKRYGIPLQVPAPYPLTEFERANLIALLAKKEGWVHEYTLTSYRHWFQDGSEAGSDAHLNDVLKEIGQEPSRVLEEAATEDVKAALEASTDEARQLGIFGSPNFVVGRELFWGDDRLEDAIHWVSETGGT